VDGLGYIQTTAPISSGSSGGALINDRGQLIGITTATFTEGQNLNLAVPIHCYSGLNIGALNPFPISRTESDYGASLSFNENLTLSAGGHGLVSITADPGSCTEPVTIRFDIEDSSIVSGEWGEWNDWDIDLYLDGLSVGSTNILITLKTSDTGKVLATGTVKVTVTPAVYTGAELSFDKTVQVAVDGDAIPVHFTVDPGSYDGYVTIRFEVNDVGYATAEWGEWEDWDIDLYVYGEKEGTATISISLMTSDEVLLCTDTLYVTISGPGYYPGYHPAPDFGAVTGVTACYVDEDAYYYYYKAFPDMDAALNSYESALISNGFEFWKEDTDSYGDPLIYYYNESHDIYICMGIDYVDEELCIYVMPYYGYEVG